jgi:hypothetical protein
LGVGLDDEEGVLVGVAGVLKLLDCVLDAGGLDGEEDGTVLAAYEVEVGFVVDEL